MSTTLVIEDNKVHPIRHPDTISLEEDDSLKQRIETLRKVAVTLLMEVEALKGTQPTGVAQGINLYDEVRQFEKDLIRQALERTGGHQTRAARLLGVKLTTLHTKIKRYKISSFCLVGDATPSRDDEPGPA